MSYCVQREEITFVFKPGVQPGWNVSSDVILLWSFGNGTIQIKVCETQDLTHSTCFFLQRANFNFLRCVTQIRVQVNGLVIRVRSSTEELKNIFFINYRRYALMFCSFIQFRDPLLILTAHKQSIIIFHVDTVLNCSLYSSTGGNRAKNLHVCLSWSRC